MRAYVFTWVRARVYEQVGTKKPGNILPVVSREESTLFCFVRQSLSQGPGVCLMAGLAVN